MATFRDHCFTPFEFSKIAKVEKATTDQLIQSGKLEIVRRKFGHVERKMIPLESAQTFFKNLRAQGSAYLEMKSDEASIEIAGEIAGMPFPQQGSGEEAQGLALGTVLSSVAAATDAFLPGAPKHKIQMFYNVKGGTGKSTLTAQYVMRASMLGLNVLALDLDGQGHLSLNLDVLDAHERPTVYDVLINDVPLSDAVITVAPGLDLLPANLGLCNIEIPLNHKPRREYRLSEAIQSIADRYDLIVADTNPAASILNSSMLVAADLVNVVCATNSLSFHGMSLVLATIEQMEREFRKNLHVKIVPNLYDNREVISQEVLGELRTQFSDSCTHAVINRSAELNEATKRRTTVWAVNAKGNAANDLSQLTEELLYT